METAAYRASIGKRLAGARERRGLSQQQVSQHLKDLARERRDPRLKRAQTAISEWEQGRNTPSAEVLAELCRLYDCSADWLLRGECYALDALRERNLYRSRSLDGLDEVLRIGAVLDERTQILDDRREFAARLRAIARHVDDLLAQPPGDPPGSAPAASEP